jgi:type I restriction enzyme S subunit
MSASWPLVSLGEVLRSVSRAEKVDPLKEYSLLGVRLDGQGPFLREKRLGSQISTSTLFRVEKGDFIYSRLFAWRGAFGIIDEPLKNCYVSGEFPTFRAHDDRIDLRYLKYWFRILSTLERVQADCTGSTPLTRNRFKEDFFLRLQIPLPPLTEQRRIVARVEELAAKIEQAKGLREQAVEEVEKLEKSALKSIVPRDCPTTLLKELICPGSTISYGVLVPGPDISDGVPFVRVQDLDRRNPPEKPNKTIDHSIEAHYSRTRLRGGEVLVGVVGSIGKVGIAPSSWAGANIARAVCRIEPAASVDNDYLAAVLESSTVQEYFQEATRTLAQPTLNVAQLELTEIPVPSLDEQRRIVAYLDSLQSKVDALKRLQDETAKELDALLPSILDTAFKGEL